MGSCFSGKYRSFLTPLFMTVIFILSGFVFCLADGTDLSKEKSFGVGHHSKMLNKYISVFDGFLFTRYPNNFTKKIDNSQAITYTYTAKYKEIDFSTMTERIINAKTYTGSIPSGKNEMFVDLKMLMKDLKVKEYNGVIGVEVTEFHGASCTCTGDAIDLRLVKTSLDAAKQMTETDQ